MTVKAGQPGGKSLFPRSWDIEDIIEATNEVLNGRSIAPVGKQVLEKTIHTPSGTVIVEVLLYDGKIRTFYPKWDQAQWGQ